MCDKLTMHATWHSRHFSQHSILHMPWKEAEEGRERRAPGKDGLGRTATRTCNVACGEIEVSVIFINNIFSLYASECSYIHTHLYVCVCAQQLGSVSLPLESKNKWQKCQQFCALHCHNDDKERALECFSLCHWVSASVSLCVCVNEWVLCAYKYQ